MDAPIARTGLLLFVALVFAGLLVAPGAALAADFDGEVTQPNVYLHDQGGEPWDSEDNDTAMSTVFGAANWEEEYFQTVNATTQSGGLFAPGVRFVFLDGSDLGADELEAFLNANEVALKSFVARGGRLILNTAPNEGNGMTYDGRQITYNPSTTSSHEVVAADAKHPIFNGPETPAGPSYSGTAFAQALVQGPGLTPLLVRRTSDAAGQPGDPNSVVLAEYRSACGVTLLGTMTMPQFHTPIPNAQNLLANIIDYAARTPFRCHKCGRGGQRGGNTAPADSRKRNCRGGR